MTFYQNNHLSGLQHVGFAQQFGQPALFKETVVDYKQTTNPNMNDTPRKNDVKVISRNQAKRIRKQAKQAALSDNAPTETDDHKQITPPVQATTVVQIDFVQMPKGLFDARERELAGLKTENSNLKNRILMMEQGEKVLQETIKNGERTIEELKKENALLMAKLNILEQTMSSWTVKNAVSIFSVALIDLLKGEKLMNKLAVSVQPVAEKLKTNRINDCHYLVHEDSEDIKTYKKYVLDDKLKNMDPAVKNYFDKVYPGVVDEVLLYLKQYPTGLVNVDEATKLEVSLWWA
jgi:hypothetical protein